MMYEPFRRLSPFVSQEQMQAAEKRRIGLAAASMIKDGQIIVLSAGTTTTQVGRSIHVAPCVQFLRIETVPPLSFAISLSQLCSVITHACIQAFGIVPVCHLKPVP